MTKLTKMFYYTRMTLFIIHFYFIFVILNSILDTELFGYIFLFIYTFYIIKVIIELLSKKDRYKNNLIYNIMNIGLLCYILIISIKISVNSLYVTKITYNYFKNNFAFLSLLIIFILVYSFVELRNNKKI